MNQEVVPQILVVDDQWEQQRGLSSALGSRAEVVLAHPNEVTQDQLSDADLVLVDLRLEEWVERDVLHTLSLKPCNGLALAAVLRSHLPADEQESPSAFAIYSAHLPDLSGGLPPESREHALARTHNLEWVFPKTDAGNTSSLPGRFISLAQAVQKLPGTWPRDDSQQMQKTVVELLDLSAANDNKWFYQAC